MGVESEVSGILAETTTRNTVNDNITVIENEIFSPGEKNTNT